MVGSGGYRLAAKRKERRVEELYNATEIVDEIEITPVITGSCRMQGPIEETDLDIQKNMVTPQAKQKFGKRSMSRKNRLRAESGTCNVCSAPCSSCMHPNMGSKAGEFSDETFRETMAFSKGRPCDSLQQAASEASNLLSVNSSHDSISANAESKPTVRSCDISYTSEDFETHPKLSSSRVGTEDQLSPKPECVLDQRIFSAKYDDSRGAEGHDDNISSVSRANDANTDVGYNDRNVDIKNISHSLASPCSLGAEGSGKAPFSQKPDLSEMPCVRKVDAGDGFPKLQSSLIHSQSDKSIIGSSSEVLTKIYPKSEAETEKDSGDPPDGTSKYLGPDEEDFKPSELAKLPDMQPSSQAASEDETDESDIVEQDVKVCDICGDAGREDLLAICSRCSDGAEHIYCMREMLQKIPEGDWLCEECKFAEETENQKQGVDAEGKRANKLSANIQGSGKRQAENLEAAPLAKRQAVETTLGSPKSSSPSKAAALSHDSSFKSLDKGKVRRASFGNDIPENIRSTATPLLQTAKATLLKSNSFSTFNSKPKVKLVDEVVPQKQKGTREPVSLDVKEGHSKTMGKSMSFKSANFGHSSAMDSKFKNLSPRFSHDVKGIKQERNAFVRKNLVKSDRPLTGSAMSSSAASMLKVDQKLASDGETMSLSSAGNNRDSQVVKSEGKVNSLSKSNSSLSHKGSEFPVTPVGAPSVNGISSSSVELKPNLVSPKDEPSSSSSWTAERPSNNVSEILQDGLPRSLESTTQSEKPNTSCTRPTLSTGSKGIPCQKCKEMGHDVESCPIAGLQVSGVDLPAGKKSRPEMIIGNKLKAAIVVAMSKLPVTYGKNRVNDQSDALGMTSVDLDCERASQGQLSVSNKMKNMVPVEATLETSTNVRNCSDSYKQTTNNVKQFNANSSDAVFPLKVEVPDSTALLRKAAMRDWPGHTLAAAPVLAIMSAIPEHEYIWQGGFVVHRGGKFLDLRGGIQAHLSSCASPKVLEMVNKFPPKIHLNEVPCVSIWPSKFHESSVKEDDIALYFFAQDQGSYERNYKGLVDSMMKNDLALKGDLDGVELLIFPSSQLPENCQRWNMLFFLWGMFRVMKVNCSNAKNSCTTSSNAAPLDRDVSNNVMSLSQNLFLSKHIDKDSSACDSSQNITPTFNGPDKICITIHGDDDNKASSDEQTSLSSRANSEQQDGLDPRFLSRTATDIVPLSQEMRSTTSLEECKLPVCREEIDLEPSHKAIRTSVGSKKGDEASIGSEMSDEMKSDRHQVDLERDLNEDVYMDTETALERSLNFKGFNCQESNHLKRSHLDLTETVSQNSSGVSQTIPWNEAFVDGESTSKKLKTGFSGTYGCSSSRERDSLSDGFSSQIDDLGPSSSAEDKRCNELCEEKVIREDLGTTERYFFPVDSQHVNDFRLGANSMPWKALPSRDEDQFRDGVPNLELALGAETKPPNKGMLPFFVASVDKNKIQDKSPDQVTDKEEEDVSASLSLSLSFPFPEEQTTVRPVSKTEKLLPERHRVNTSLLLFGGLLKKLDQQ